MPWQARSVACCLDVPAIDVIYRLAHGVEFMRAEAQAMVTKIEESLSLLRRRL
jgi:hypothetical protein